MQTKPDNARRGGYYVNIKGKDIFIITNKYYIKDKDIRRILLKLNIFNITGEETKRLREKMIRGQLLSITGENGIHRVKLKKDSIIKSFDDLLIIYNDAFRLGGDRNG